NLLSNAIKYSTAEHPVTVSLSRVDGETLIGVSDLGTGIAADALPHLFERFYRAPGIEVQYGSGVGLGLGLYIARELVERHGGRLWAASEPGVGSTFWLALPLTANAPPLDTAAADSTDEGAGDDCAVSLGAARAG
ncbi:MAG TPA: ATP-binding protein, partial [Ktedonobacterales bacterium]|nr:ATP-binding protein [Ktedonobacterales bacterium]